MTRITLPLLLLYFMLSPAFIWVAGGKSPGSPTPTPKQERPKPPAKPGASAPKPKDGSAQPDPVLTRSEERIGKLEERAQAVETRTDELGRRLDVLPSTSTAQATSYERWGLLAGLAVSLAGLGVLGGATFKLRKQLITLRTQAMVSRRRSARRKDGGTEKNDEDAGSYAELKSEFKTALAEQSKCLRGEISKLEARINALSELITERDGLLTQQQAAPAADGDGRRKGTLRLSYPATVDECLTRSQEAQMTLLPVKSDPSHFNNLAQDGDNRFWLAQDDGGHECLLFPKARRFSSDDEFYTFYEKYYECAEPSAGAVLIIRPGIVEEDEMHGGWKVKTKGELKVE